MKIKLSEILPNPFRDFTFCPIDQKKVDALVDSIKQTGFWDNVVVRPHPTIPGIYQQAYGHNRLMAAGIVFGHDYQVDVPVRELSDEIMLQMMASENMEYWATSPAVIDETVRQSKKFLEDHPEIAAKYSVEQIRKHNDINRRVISAFLGWNESKVTFSLERLHLVDEGKVEPDIIAMFDTEGSARTFVNTIKDRENKGTPIPKEKHREIVERFKDSRNSSNVLKEAVNEAVFDAIYETPKKPKKETNTETIRKIEDEVANVNLQIEGLRNALKRIHMIYDGIGGVPEQWDGFNWHDYLINNLNRITSEISDFMNISKNIKELTA